MNLVLHFPARRPKNLHMNFIPDNLYHIYNQGNNQQNIFFDKDDYLIFLREVRKLLLPHCEIVAYCLMPNHFHLMVYTDERVEVLIKQGGLMIDKLTNGMRKLLSGYARIYNKKYSRTGSLFRQKTKYKLLSNDRILSNHSLSDSDYCCNCFHYIHQNPWRANLVNRMEDWDYSSFKDYAGLRNGSLCNKKLAEKYCSYNPKDFMKESYRDLTDDFDYLH